MKNHGKSSYYAAMLDAASVLIMGSCYKFSPVSEEAGLAAVELGWLTLVDVSWSVLDLPEDGDPFQAGNRGTAKVYVGRESAEVFDVRGEIYGIEHDVALMLRLLGVVRTMHTGGLLDGE